MSDELVPTETITLRCVMDSDSTFGRVFDQIPGNGWLERDEAKALWDACRSTTGPILEIGTYFGRSATLLGAIAVEQDREIHLCDPYDDGHHFHGKETELALQAKANVVESLTKIGALGRFTLHEMTEEEFSRDLADDAEFGFIYFDGHAEGCEGTKAQIDRWLPRCSGLVALHDYATSGGGASVQMAIITTRELRIQSITNRLAVCEIIR